MRSRSRHWSLLVLTLVASASLTFSVPEAIAAGTTVRASLASDETQGNAASSMGIPGQRYVSDDGRYVVFSSSATNLVAGDTNGVEDVFVRDTVAGTTELISIATTGGFANGQSNAPTISSNGQYVVFSSTATNLIASDTNAKRDVFVRNRTSGTTIRASVASGGAQGTGDSLSGVTTPGGNIIVFVTEAVFSELDTNGVQDIYVRDVIEGTTSLLSYGLSCIEGCFPTSSNGFSSSPSISEDGRYVSFDSMATNMVFSDTNGVRDVFRHDRDTGNRALISVASGEAFVQANGESSSTSISGDGNKIAFMSAATNLAGTDTNGSLDVFVRTVSTLTTARASVSTTGGETNGDSYWPALSSDGRYVAFHTFANNTVAGDTSGNSDIVRRDLQTSTTLRITLGFGGAQPGHNSFQASINATGDKVVFHSLAGNFVADDTNGVQDVFLHTVVPVLPITNLSLTVTPVSTKAGVSNIPFASVPASQIPEVADDAEASVGTSPVSRIPVSRIPVSRIPVSRIDPQTAPVSRIPVSRIGLDQASLGPVAMNVLDDVLLSTLQVDLSALVAGTPLESLPFQTLTMKQALENATVRARLALLEYRAVRGLGTTLLRGTPAALAFIGTMSWNDLGPTPAGGSDWCAYMNTQFGVANACSTFGITPASTTPLGAAIAQAPVSRIPVSRIPVSRIDAAAFAASPFGQVPLSGFLFSITKMAGTPVSQATGGASSVIANCSTFNCTSGTLAEAQAANAFKPAATIAALGAGVFNPDGSSSPNGDDVDLQDLVLGIIGLDGVPWGALNLGGAQLYAGNGNTVTYNANFDVTCSGISSVRVRIAPPSEFEFVPGSTRYQVDTGGVYDVPDPTPAPYPESGVVWNSLSNPCDGAAAGSVHHVHLAYQMYPGVELGTFASDIHVSAAGEDVVKNTQAPVHVTEVFENNDDPANAAPLANRTLLVSQIRQPGDIDLFTLPVPPRGSRVTLTLANPSGHDFDLALNIPEVAGPNSAPVSRIPVSRITVQDDGRDLNGADEQLPPDTIEDIPVSRIPVSRISARHDDADEVISFTTGSETGNYTLQVSGYNGDHSPEHYLLWATVQTPLALPPCPARTLPFNETSGSSDIGSLPPVSAAAGKATLFVTNRDRTSDLGGGTATTEMYTKLAAVAARTEVNGLVLEVDGDSIVRQRAANWDLANNVCSTETANAYVRSIIDVVNRYRTAATKYVVVVGSDEVIPSWRQPDPVTEGAESDSWSELAFSTEGLTKANAAFAAAFDNQILTDEAYGVIDEYVAGGNNVLHGGVVVSRLVERPQDISGQLQQYIDNDGFVDLGSAGAVTEKGGISGYDFLTDGSEASRASLNSLLGAANVNNLVNDTWTRTEFVDEMFAQRPKIIAPNAHFTHNVGEPAAADPSDGVAQFEVSDLFTPSDLPAANPLLSTVVFTVGCHAGRSVADSIALLSSVDPDENDAPEVAELKKGFFDWAQAWAKQKSAVYIANSTYGYGDTEENALSERLMSIFAELLKEDTPLGEKFAKAKHLYWLTKGQYGAYDDKVLMGAHLFGLPHFRLRNGNFSTPNLDPLIAAPGTGSTASTGDINLNPTQVTLPDGTTYWHQNGRTDITHFRMPQPLTVRRVGLPAGQLAAGTLLRKLVTHDVVNIKPYLAVPNYDSSAHEAKATYRDAPWPAGTINLLRSRLFGQDEMSLTIAGGSFIPTDHETGVGAERLIDTINVEISYAAAEGPRPEFKQVRALDGGATKTFFVEVSDGTGTLMPVVEVFYKQEGASGAWTFLPLTRIPGTDYYTGSANVGGQIEYGAQARNAQGYTGHSTNKVFLFNAKPAADDLAPEVFIDSPLPGQRVTVGATVPALFTCFDDTALVRCDATNDGVPITNGGSLATSAGPHTLTVVAEDAGGEITEVTRTYNVSYEFIGFKAPVDNFPVLNTVKAGSTVPVKWQLKDANGNYVRVLTAVSSVVDAALVCSNRPSDAIESTSSVPVSGLSYDTAGEQYLYYFATQKGWAGTCRRLTVTLTGGQRYFADFKFR